MASLLSVSLLASLNRFTLHGKSIGTMRKRVPLITCFDLIDFPFADVGCLLIDSIVVGALGILLILERLSS